MKYNVNDFSLDEKIKLVVGKDCWSTNDLNNKLYKVVVSDGPLGLRKTISNPNGDYDKPSVSYPSGEVLSQTWNMNLVHKMASSLADDCIENNVDILLGPGINIKRSPICGRNFEYLSEDPYLAGVVGREYIKAMQAKHVGTCLKHFCANNREVGRIWKSSEVDERTLREIYLKGFEIATKANPWSVMCSYNLVNGVRMSEHAKLYKVLRQEFWRTDGPIISDWDAVRSRSVSIKAGLDLEMPFNKNSYENIKKALDNNEITIEELDNCVERVLKLIEKCETEKSQRQVSTSLEDRLNIAKEIAEEGIVLLKNNDILPITDGKSVSIACTHAKEHFSGGGSSRVQIIGEIKPLAAALKEDLPNSEITSASLWDYNSSEYVNVINNACFKDIAIVVCSVVDTEGDDRESMRLRANEEKLIINTANKNPNTIVILHCGAAIDVSPWIDLVAGVVSVGYTGEKGNEAIANILTGKVNPSGKLTETFANHIEDYLSESCYRDHLVDVYSDGLSVGYRYFDRHPEKICYPFGFGLSYSTFEYKNLGVSNKKDVILVSFDIKNSSKVDGAEIAQIYISAPQSRVFRPLKELKGFDKVFIKANEIEHVFIEIDKKDLSFYSIGLDKWVLEKGIYEVQVGSSSQNILLKQTIEIK